MCWRERLKNEKVKKQSGNHRLSPCALDHFLFHVLGFKLSIFSHSSLGKLGCCFLECSCWIEICTVEIRQRIFWGFQEVIVQVERGNFLCNIQFHYLGTRRSVTGLSDVGENRVQAVLKG